MSGKHIPSYNYCFSGIAVGFDLFEKPTGLNHAFGLALGLNAHLIVIQTGL